MKRLAIFLIAVALLSPPSPSRAESDANTCNGIDFDPKRAIVVSKISAQPRVNFVKNSYDDAACPADTEACRRKAYLVPGDLVLTGRRLGPFNCVAYQSPLSRKQDWTSGWLPTSALTPVAPMTAPKRADWTGTWKHAGGEITISAKDGKLSIEGLQTYPAAQNVHTGVLGAENVQPSIDTIVFADDNSAPPEKISEGECIVRMQRIGPWLLVEDNGGCGGSMVTFTGLYRRGK